MEKGRVDFNQGKAQVVAYDNLQNKAKRYYFTDAFRLKPGDIFVSPFDLNVERGKVEVPHKPMIRIATPIIDKSGVKRGIVLLNYYGSDLLQRFTTASANIVDHISLLNKDGYWLKSPQKHQEWGFMLGKKNLTLAKTAPQAWKVIQEKKSGQVSIADGLWTWETVYPLLASQHSSTSAISAFQSSSKKVNTAQYAWKVVAHLSSATLSAVKYQVWKKLFFITIVLLLIAAYGSWKVAQAWIAQSEAEEKVRHINTKLEQLVQQRTEELHKNVLELDNALLELGQKNKEMESMIYIASHDLRSPLINIQGFSQRLEKSINIIGNRLSENDVPAEITESLTKILNNRIPTALEFIKSSSLKMDSLINGLLRLSRAGRVQLNVKALDINMMMEQIINNLTIQIQKINAKITVETLPPCLGDTDQLNQVFSNIIDNAIKYHEPSRQLNIHISGYIENNTVVYKISDNGIGIEPDQRPKIWELFHRLDPAGSVAGEGVGLTLVQRIVERLHGSISISSEQEQGSCFIIKMPVIEGEK